MIRLGKMCVVNEAKRNSAWVWAPWARGCRAAPPASPLGNRH